MSRKSVHLHHTPAKDKLGGARLGSLRLLNCFCNTAWRGFPVQRVFPEFGPVFTTS